MKKKIWKINLIVFVFFFLVACKSKNESGKIEKIEVELGKIHVEKIENVFSESDTIYLETTTKSLIKSVVRISFTEDKIFIWDSPNKLLVFSENGTFIGNIGTKGQASFEFAGVNDYFIRNDTVFIFDFNGKKILKYGTDGDYIGNTLVEQHFSRICPLLNNEGYIVINTFSNREDNPKFSWLDYDFKVRYSSREQLLHGSSFSTTFFQNGAFFVYWEMFNNTIYSVARDGVSPKYIVDFKKYAFPSDITEIPKFIEYYTQHSSNVAGMINNVIETEESIAFMFAHDNASHWALVNKSSNNVRIFKLTDVKEPFGKLNSIVTYHNGWFYGIYVHDDLRINDNYALIRFRISNP